MYQNCMRVNRLGSSKDMALKGNLRPLLQWAVNSLSLLPLLLLMSGQAASQSSGSIEELEEYFTRIGTIVRSSQANETCVYRSDRVNCHTYSHIGEIGSCAVRLERYSTGRHSTSSSGRVFYNDIFDPPRLSSGATIDLRLIDLRQLAILSDRSVLLACSHGQQCASRFSINNSAYTEGGENDNLPRTDWIDGNGVAIFIAAQNVTLERLIEGIRLLSRACGATESPF